MNILFISYSFTPYAGGVQRVTDVLSKEFQARGHKVYYLCGRAKSDERDENLSAEIFYMDKSISVAFDGSSKSLYQNLLKDLNINVIVNQYPILSKSDFFLKNALPGITKISFFHGKPFGFVLDKILILKKSINPINLLKLAYYRMFYLFLVYRFGRIAKLSDKFCFLSKYYVNDVLTKIKCYSSKLVAIPNPNTFEVDFSNNLKEKKNKILFVGRLNDTVKNLWDFIKMWEILSLRLCDWEAEIIGDNTYMNEYMDYIERKKIQRINFLGYKKDVSTFYKEAKFLCVMSRHEGWPMVISEAMSYGCIPCSYTTYGAVYSLISDGVDGILCTPFDVKGMSQKLVQTIESDDMVYKMACNARNKVLNFSVKNIALEWENLFMNKI